MSKNDNAPPRVTMREVERNKRLQAEERAREERESKERHDKESARKAWLAEGGAPGGFESQWPTICEGMRRAAVQTRIEQQRQDIARSYRESF
jgi:hypothetical protein